MSGSVPNDRAVTRARAARRARGDAHVVLLGTLALLSACAHAPPERTLPDPEMAKLRVALAEREQAIEQLEGRLALRDAPRHEVYAEAPKSASTEVSAAAPPRGLAEAAAVRDEPAQAGISNGPRPLLRLHEDRGELVSTWMSPTATERLKVAPLPSLPGVAPTREDAAQDLYVRALDLVRRREFPEALRELDAFLLSFPRDPRVVRAHFWRGEVLFAQREYAYALEAFETVRALEPRGEKAADVLLRLARCSLRLGAPERARTLLEQLEAEYPDSDAARLVRQGKQEDT